MTLDGLDCFEFFEIFFFPNELIFPASILRAIHSIDICTVKINNIRNMRAVLTSHITDIWPFNNKMKYKIQITKLYFKLKRCFHYKLF